MKYSDITLIVLELIWISCATYFCALVIAEIWTDWKRRKQAKQIGNGPAAKLDQSKAPAPRAESSKDGNS